MFLKNTVNVFASNFTLTYRLLLYKLLVFALCIAIGFATVLPLLVPVVEDMQSAGVFETASLITQSFADSTLFSDSVSVEILQTVHTVRDILIYHSESLLSMYVGFAILLLFWYFCSAAIDVAICEVIHFFCKQKSRRSLMACFISRFVEVSKYTVFKMFLILPVEICVIALSLLVYIFNIGGIFSTSIAILLLFGLFPLKDVFVTCFIPSLVCSGKGLFASFKHGLNLSLSKGIKIYSTHLCVLICGAIFCLMTSIVSLGALTIYSFAVFSIYKKCLSFVIYYNLEGMRFYSDSETIVTPYIVKVQEGDYTVDLL